MKVMSNKSSSVIYMNEYLKEQATQSEAKGSSNNIFSNNIAAKGSKL